LVEAEEEINLDHGAVKEAFVKAINIVGLELFRKTSMFGSNEHVKVRTIESLAA